MDERTERETDRRSNLALRTALLVLQVEVARARLLLDSPTPVPPDRRSSMSRALDEGFSGLLTAVRSRG